MSCDMSSRESAIVEQYEVERWTSFHWKFEKNCSRIFRTTLTKRVFLLVDEFTAGLPMSYKLGPRWNAVITRPDFKSEAIFGFLSPNYIGKST